jgi:tRNA nucleotidyltransferase/poly(A) polymerase
LKADAERRDLTANSLFKNVSTGEIIDLTGKGKEDLTKGIARTPLDPDETFSDDPLRMMRLIRFYVKYNWKIPLDIVRSLKRNSNQIVNISGERIQDELNKILKTNNAGKAFKLLRQSQLADYIFPDVEITSEKLKMIQQADNPLVKLSSLYHDMPKQFIESSLKKIKYPNETVSAVSNVVSLQNFFNNEVSEKKIREFRRVAGKYASSALELIDLLHKPINIDKILDFLEGIQNEPMFPPVDGNDIIALGVKEGPKIGQLKKLIQSKFEENPYISREELLSFLLKNK